MRRLGTAGLMLLLGLAVAAGPAAAEVYSWTDRDGVVHFTNLRGKRKGNWRKLAWSTPSAGSKAAAHRGGCERCDKVPSKDNSPDRFARYDAHIAEASALFQIPEPLIRAVIHVESDYDPNVVSAMDAKGLMQLMPDIVREMGVPDDQAFDPRLNILGGTRLLRTLANRYQGDLVLTIAAYHAGPGSLAKFGNTVPPYQYTRQYLRMVLDRYQRYQAKPGR